MRILITGTSSGIGQSLARHLAAADHAVWGVARSEQQETFATSIADVADWTAMQRVAEQIRATWGGLDAVICAAAVQGEIGPALTLDPARWSATVRTNLDGTFHTIRACSELLGTATSRRKIICFSGGGATKSRPNFSAYGASKCAVVRLVETIADENPDLDCNAVAPGAINTRMTCETAAAGHFAGAEASAAARQLETGGQSLDKALALCAWLLSPASDGVSGRLISAQWDDWTALAKTFSTQPDFGKLRRIELPKP